MRLRRNTVLTVLIAVAVFASAFAVGYVLWPRPEVRPVMPESVTLPGISPSGQQAIRRIVNELGSVRLSALSPEQAAFLADTALHSDEVPVVRYALASMAEHLHAGTRLPEGARQRFEDVLVHHLAHPDKHLRSAAITGVKLAGLHTQPDVRERLESIRDSDPEPDLQFRAAMILGADAPDGG